MSVKKCSDCGVGMEIGAVPSYGHVGAPQACWYPGIGGSGSVFNYLTGAVGESSNEGLPLVVYRCPECGVLKTYAVERLW